MTIASRGRPASVDVDTHLPDSQPGPNPGVQAVTRRGPNQGNYYFLLKYNCTNNGELLY